jgi:hypothetical protein
MNFLSRLLLALALGALPTATFAAFEGRVTLAFKAGREAEQVIAYAMKDGLIRMEPQIAEAAGMAMILNLEKGETTIIMPEQAMYMVMPMRAPSRPAAKVQGPEPKVEKTGEKDLILGYPCDQYLSVENGETTEMWITEELGTFAGLGTPNPMAGMMGGGGAPARDKGWEQALKGRKGAFPLRVISRDAKGRETFRLEARKVEPGSLPASDFKPPAGFQKMNLPMMGGFGG